MAYGYRHRVDPRLPAGRHGRLNGSALTTDHGLARAVDVRDDDVAVRLGDNAFHGIQWAEDRGHCAVVADVEVGHLLAPRTDRFQRRVEGQRTGRLKRPVFAQAVPHDHVRLDAVGGQHPGERQIGRQDGGLGDLGLQELLLQLPNGLVVTGVDEDERRQWAAQQRRHDAVRLGERLGDDRLAVPQVLQHVDVLGPLTRVEEGDLGGCPTPDEYPLGAQHAEPRGVRCRQRLDGLRQLAREISWIRVVDGDPHGCPGQRRVGNGRARGTPLHRFRLQVLQLPHDRRVVGTADDERSAQRGLGPAVRDAVGTGRGRRAPTRILTRGWRRRGRRHRGGEDSGAVAISAGNVLLHHGMEVRAAEAECAHPAATGALR